MAKTISQLPDATVVNGSDELIIQQSGVTKRATKTEVLAGIVNSNVDAAAAIAGTKISPDFGSQNIVTTGSIGAGTTSPDVRIEAEGAAFVGIQATSTSADSAAALIVKNDARDWRIQVQGSVADQLWIYDNTAAATRMAITAGGGVGIGTTSIGSGIRLDVHNTAFAATRIKSNDGDSTAALVLENDAREWRIQCSGNDSDKLYFYDDDAVAVRMVIDSSGNVGIGTTSPATRLHVDGATRSTTYQVGTNQVVGARATGWAAPTGTATRTTFATSTVTTAQLAERVKALIDDLTTHGLIGT